MMEVALYLLPVTLGETPVENVLPVYNKEVILGIKHFIVEDVRSARRFLKKVDRGIDIDALTFYPLNKHTSPEDISGYLNLTVNTWGCGLLIYRRYSHQKPTCLRLPLYWSCGM